MKLVSFFLATMNRVIDLEETIQKIYEQNYKKFEIVIVDNGSNDGTSEMIKKYDKVKYTYLKENIGAIPARNIAMKKCNGEILVSLDDDSFPGKNSITKLMQIFEKKSIGLVSFKILDYSQYIDKYYELSNYKSDEIINNYFWSGCGGAFRSDILKKLGYWEEWGRESPFELSTSAKMIFSNLRCVSNDQVYVFHKWSQSGEPAKFRISDSAFSDGTKSYIKYLFKFCPISFFLLNELLYLLYLSIYDLVSRRRKLIILAFFSAILELNSICSKRLPIDLKEFKKILPAKNILGK